MIKISLRWVSELQGRGQFLNRPIWARVFLAGLSCPWDFKVFERNFRHEKFFQNSFQKAWNFRDSWDQPKKPGLIWGGSKTAPAWKPNANQYLLWPKIKWYKIKWYLLLWYGQKSVIPENPTQFSTYYGQELITFKKISADKLSKNDQKELKEKWGPKINGETGVVCSFFPKMVKFRAAPPGLHRRGHSSCQRLVLACVTRFHLNIRVHFL